MPPSSEHTPLLDGPTYGQAPTTFAKRVKRFVTAEGEPSWAASLNFLLFNSWMNLLLVFVPLSAISHYANWEAGIRFLFSLLAIAPLAMLLGEVIEQLSMECGQTLGGLLNASFGNSIEIIVGIAALIHGQLRIVQTSMIGSILSKQLLVLGMSFFAGGMVYQETEFQQTAAQTSCSLMMLACIILVIPAAYHSAKPANAMSFNSRATGGLVSLLEDQTPNPGDDARSGLLSLSRGTSILLLIVYFAFLYFQLKSHAHLFQASWEEEEGSEEIKMSMVSVTIALLVITVVTSLCAGYFVASIEETAEQYNIPKQFIGIILLPLVGNLSETVTSVRMAVKGKAEMTIGICVGSSIQISVFVIPLLIIVGWVIGQDLSLYFANFETICLFLSVMLASMLIQDGKSNYLEGLLLMTLYLVIALAFWVS